MEGHDDFNSNTNNRRNSSTKSTIKSRSTGAEEGTKEYHVASSTSSPSSFPDINNVMESVVRITLAGFGGSIVGLSLEKRLESMRVTTAAGLTAAARRKRSPSASLVNLPLTWGFSCMIFCLIVETCRLTSPATWISQKVGGLSGGTIGVRILHSSDNRPRTLSVAESMKPPAITIADYAIGGAVAGMAGSFGRRMHFRNSIARMQGSRKFFGLLPGIGFGLAAGCLQAATDYGTILALRASTSNSTEE
jgi:hypothetical protein